MTERAFSAEPGSLAIETTYVFDAPRDRVFEVYNNPELTGQWWGPEGIGLTVKRQEVEDGGSWQFELAFEDPMTFRGVYHQVTAPEQVVFTWQLEGTPILILQNVTFEDEADGRTKVTDRAVFQTVEVRDSMLDSGMGEGSLPAFDRLAKLL